MKLVVGVAIAATLALPATVEAACRTVPLEFYGGNPLTRVRVNAGQPTWFLLDTASTFTFIDASLAASLGLKTQGALTLTGGNGDRAGVTFADDVAFETAGVQTTSRAAVMPLRFRYDRPIAGILGAPFLRQFVSRLDYRASRLDVCDGAGWKPPFGAESIPFRLEEEIPVIDLRVKLRGRDEVVAPVFVDTGASQALFLNRPFVAAHRLAEGQVFEERRAGSLTGPMTYQVTQAEYIRLGRRVHADVLVGFSPSERTNRAGTIGNAILRDYVMTLDYRERRMYLEDQDR